MSTRGSWQERQNLDANSLRLPNNAGRFREALYLPLFFYLFAFLNFFMTAPRSWNAIGMQQSDQQSWDIARPSATDARFKTAAVLASIAWLGICYDLRYNVINYLPDKPSRLQLLGIRSEIPMKLLLGIALSGLRVGYTLAGSFYWTLSPLRIKTSIGWFYGLGYGPVLLTLCTFNFYGCIEMNEDRQLIEQRATREEAINAELGIRSRNRYTTTIQDPVQVSSTRHIQSSRDRIASVSSAGAGAESLEMRGLGLGQAQDPFQDDPDKVNAFDVDDQDGSWWWQRKKREHEKEHDRSRSRYVWGSSMLMPEEEETDLSSKKHKAGDDLDTSRKPDEERARQQNIKSMLDI